MGVPLVPILILFTTIESSALPLTSVIYPASFVNDETVVGTTGIVGLLVKSV